MIVLQVADKGGVEMLAASQELIEPWARSHGYDYHRHYVARTLDNPYRFRWNVVAYLLREKRDSVLYLDNDIVPQLGGHFPALPEGTDINFSKDSQGLCAGAFHISCNLWSKWFVETAILTIPDKQTHRTEDQDVLKALVSLRNVSKHVGYISESVIANPTSTDGPATLYHHWANADPGAVVEQILKQREDRPR
jgi:hypothetical protein